MEHRCLLAVVVDTLADELDGSIADGDISLRDAIALAPIGESITFAAGLNGGTIQLTEGELTINKSLTIDATGLANGLTIDASGNDATPGTRDGAGTRVLKIDDGNDSISQQVTLRGLTITGGDVLERGGAIMSRESITIQDSTISGNAATNSAPAAPYEGDGGAIWARAGAGAIVIENTRVVNNHAEDDGGGLNLLVESGQIRIIGSEISGNTAAGNDPQGPNLGGGVRLSSGVGGSILIEDSTVENNAGSGPSFLGGGIAMLGSGSVSVHGTMVRGNTSTADGGGMHIRAYANSQVSVTDSTISGNTAVLNGAGANLVNTGGVIEVTRAVIENNELLGNPANPVLQEGAGLRLYAGGESQAIVSESRISGNTAGDGISGAGVSFVANGDLSIQDSTISGNTGGSFGGGLLAARGNFNIARSTVTDNQGRYGGGMYVSGVMAIDASTISNNSANYGGAINAEGNLTITNSTLSGNTAQGFGGAINAGRIRSYAGYINNYPTTLQMFNTTVSGNSAGAYGGGVFLNAEPYNTSVLKHVTITGNTTDSDSDNTGGGGGLFVLDGLVLVENSIIAGNFDNGFFAPDLYQTVDGVDSAPPDLTLRYTLLGDNGGTDYVEASAENPDPDGNIVGGALAGVIDPMLGDLQSNGGSTHTHLPLSGSPAINAGDPSFTSPPVEDQRGNPYVRVASGRIDMGAVETQIVINPADFDGDQDADCFDIDALSSAIVAQLNEPSFDLTGDGQIDQDDLAEWLVVAGQFQLPGGVPYLPGDANLDGNVDGTDLGIWNANQFATTGLWCSGDFNLDGFTDGSDFNIWLIHRFRTGEDVVVPAALPRTPRAALASGAAASVATSAAPFVAAAHDLGIVKLVSSSAEYPVPPATVVDDTNVARRLGAEANDGYRVEHQRAKSIARKSAAARDTHEVRVIDTLWSELGTPVRLSRDKS